jgi:hypothetical protein
MNEDRKRSRHSFRERIREVIQDRIALGKPLNHREILKEAGGGSAGTVVEELALAQRQTPATLIGRGAKALPQRIAALEDALNASLNRIRILEAENQALKSSLAEARNDLNQFLAVNQDAQRMLLQGVDDLRRIVKAGQGARQHEIPAPERNSATKAGNTDTPWKARENQLVGQIFALETRNRKMAQQLHELGINAEET